MSQETTPKTEPAEKVQPFTYAYVELLVKVVIYLIVVEYTINTIFAFQGSSERTRARVDSLILLVYALVLMITSQNFTSRIKSFSVNFNDQQN